MAVTLVCLATWSPTYLGFPPQEGEAVAAHARVCRPCHCACVQNAEEAAGGRRALLPVHGAALLFHSCPQCPGVLRSCNNEWQGVYVMALGRARTFTTCTCPTLDGLGCLQREIVTQWHGGSKIISSTGWQPTLWIIFVMAPIHHATSGDLPSALSRHLPLLC